MTKVIPVRGAIFENRFVAKVEIYSPGDWPALVGCQHHKAIFRGDDVLMNFFEKRPRLRRKAMVFAGLTMKAVKCFQVSTGVPNRNIDAFPVGLADVAARAVPESFFQRGPITVESDDMNELL